MHIFVLLQTVPKAYKKLSEKNGDDAEPMINTDDIHDNGSLDNSKEKTYTLANQPDSCAEPEPTTDKDNNVTEHQCQDCIVSDGTVSGTIVNGEVSQYSGSDDSLVVKYVVSSNHDSEKTLSQAETSEPVS